MPNLKKNVELTFNIYGIRVELKVALIPHVK